jgi:hypothetical protein
MLGAAYAEKLRGEEIMNEGACSGGIEEYGDYSSVKLHARE